jgi:molybdopterin-dependent oxidoreductase alpha subunit
MKPTRSGGGPQAILYALRVANQVGWKHLWHATRSKNVCKTCAFGMGGQLGGMVNEGGHFPEVCKKSLQAIASDMQEGITADFFARFSIAQLRTLSSRELERCGRLVDPVYAGHGDSHYRVLSWNEALDRLARSLKAAGPAHSFFYASGRSSNEAGFLLQMLARLFGTNYVNNCSYYCHQASSVGLMSALGSGFGTVRLKDLDHCDLYILMGGNPASNHPRLIRNLMSIRRRGGHVIVINPARETGLVNFRVPSDARSFFFGSSIASLYVQPHIGGDIALLTGVAKHVLEKRGEHRAFIDDHTEGFDSFTRRVESTPWSEIEKAAGVSRAALAELAGLYMSARNAVIGWTMGITHHLHGVENVQMIANLALLRGMVGRPHAGLMPIRGHSNVQGVGSVGVTPQLKQAILARFEQHLGMHVPTTPGLDTMGCMEAAGRGEMRAAMCLGGNLYGSNPDSTFATKALGQLDSVAYLSTTLNTGHAWGTAKETLILPVLPRDEESQPTTQESMFSFVRMSDGGPARYAGPRSEVSILAHLGQTLVSDAGVDWRDLESHRNIRALIGRLIPGLEPMVEIDRTRTEFHIAGRHLDRTAFPTPSGKARFHDIALPSAPQTSDRQLRLMTVRSEGQFNTVVYEEQDIYRGQERRDVILINPADMRRLGLTRDQPVTVRSAVGELRQQLVRPFEIRPGNVAMYYPESNVLVPRDVDPRSRTPAFKSVIVELVPDSSR